MMGITTVSAKTQQKKYPTPISANTKVVFIKISTIIYRFPRHRMYKPFKQREHFLFLHKKRIMFCLFIYPSPKVADELPESPIGEIFFMQTAYLTIKRIESVRVSHHSFHFKRNLFETALKLR